MSGLTPDIILKENNLFTEFKGIISEQFVCQHIVNQSYTSYY
jgi:hypothetical protein